MSEPFDSIAAVRKEWPSLDWPVRLMYLSVPVLIVLGATVGILAGWQAVFPGHEKVVEVAEGPSRTPSGALRGELVAALRGLAPESFTISRAVSDRDASELASALREDLVAAHWRSDSGDILVGDSALGPGVTIHMKRSPPASIYLLNWLNRAGVEARGLADVPLERTYDVALEIGRPAQADAPR